MRSELYSTGIYALEESQHFSSGPSSWRYQMRLHAWRPPTDMYETEDSVVVRLEIAGMSEDGFKIELDGRSLTIRGSRSDLPERRAYHQMEIHYGEFSVEVELPVPVASEKSEANYSNGFLRVILPKAPPKPAHTD